MGKKRLSLEAELAEVARLAEISDERIKELSGKTDELGIFVPTEPDPAEHEDFAAWKKRWDDVWETGHEQKWLAWSGGYDEGEYVPRSPQERWDQELAEYRRSRRQAARRRVEQRTTELQERAERAAQNAAKRARDAVYAQAEGRYTDG